jgi:3-deoxy-manno-octulosonate cytidylyltransferase (CMP-KDO synthetase)
MKILGIIPARYASTRFPGKPLIDILGKTMIQRVYEQAAQSNFLSAVVVATDDDRIFQEVLRFGGKVVMTAKNHRSGTDRCKEALEIYQNQSIQNFDAVVNIQGDEPYIHPQQIDQLCLLFQDKNVQLGTLVKKSQDLEKLQSPNAIKVTLTHQNYALYFSRSLIPFYRETETEKFFWKHIGIYGYRADVLSEITNIEVSSLEIAESLEQLRWLENGYKIKVGITEYESQSIDSPEDLTSLLNQMKCK